MSRPTVLEDNADHRRFYFKQFNVTNEWMQGLLNGRRSYLMSFFLPHVYLQLIEKTRIKIIEAEISAIICFITIGIIRDHHAMIGIISRCIKPYTAKRLIDQRRFWCIAFIQFIPYTRATNCTAHMRAVIICRICTSAYFPSCKINMLRICIILVECLLIVRNCDSIRRVCMVECLAGEDSV